MKFINIFNRLEKRRKAFQTFDLSLKSCEKSIQDLDSESFKKFSTVGSNVDEPKKQLDDIMVSECFIEYTRPLVEMPLLDIKKNLISRGYMERECLFGTFDDFKTCLLVFNFLCSRLLKATLFVIE